MTKLIALTTAATLALSGAAFAQEAQTDTTRAPAPVQTVEAMTIRDAATKAGIKSMDGKDVGQDAPAPTEVPMIAEPLAEDEALAEAREMFSAADRDGDEVLSADEFVAAMRPTADAIKSTSEPLVAQVETEVEPAETQGESTENEGEEAVLAEAETEAEVTPSDYLTAKFEMISGVDGQLSLDEFESAQAADFEAADADGDARLDEEEAQAFAALKTGRAAF